MAGQYVTFVAHGVPSEALSVCNLGVFGNSLVRDTPPESKVEIFEGEVFTT